MSLPLWTKYDASMYRALSLFPEKLEEKPLSPSEFTSHFKDFYGRPVQDIVEALRRYGQQGYFNFELTLAPEYLNHGQALAEVMVALNRLADPDAAPDKYRGLGKPVYDKVLAEQPLTKAEASALPDGAKSYLAFMLSSIDRQRLKEELAIYDSGVSFQPSRLVKATQANTKPKLNLHDVHLTPESYNKNKGVLYLTPVHKRVLAGKTGVWRPKNSKKREPKYMQCWVMECLFKSDKTLVKGVEVSAILGVSKLTLRNNDNIKRKIPNAVAEINKKVADDGGTKKLIRIEGSKVKVEQSYL